MCFFRKRKQKKLEEQRKAEEAARLAKEKELAEAKAKAEAEEAKRQAEEEAKRQAEEEAKKKAAPKKTPAKKVVKATSEAPKKAPVKKIEEVKEDEPVKVDTSTTTINKVKDSKSVYHVSKREDDGMWQIKYTGGRVIKLCKTKVEAMNYAKEMAANQEGTVIFHPSKGANKGKFQKA